MPMLPVPSAIRFQPVAADEVAARLVELALGQPAADQHHRYSRAVGHPSHAVAATAGNWRRAQWAAIARWHGAG